MTGKSRRHFLQFATASLGAGAVLGAMPGAIRKALAIPAASRHGTIADVEHVIVLMQENRSFDHYYGTLRGVRGFSDPHPISLPDGQSVWHQPAGKGKQVTPFHLDTKSAGGMVVPSLDHSWKESHDLWKHHDAWIARKTAMTMGYFTREDLPFYYALADAFTICDAYHCSIFGPTNPNRLFLMTGTSGLSTGRADSQVIRNPDGDINDGADPDKDTPSFKGFHWTSYAERLEQAGIDWRVYQEYDNFGDNALSYFAQFRGLPKGASLRKRARSISPGSTPANARASRGEFLIAEMENDIRAGRLPQVSWIVASSILSEHPACSSPLYGEVFVSKLLEMLTRYPDVWAKTALFINYDENDGIFDHMP
ncbi:MAG: alkaline phosphatase family protein, partial [Rhizomicrobium sp.]